MPIQIPVKIASYGHNFCRTNCWLYLGI